METLDEMQKRWRQEWEKLLQETHFVVEATSCEVQMLWEKFCKDTLHKIPFSVHDWKQHNSGRVVEVGRVNDLPVNISLQWAWIDGVLVLFYEAISRMVDYDLVKQWLERNCSPLWDGGSRLAHTNASNFHHVLDFIKNESRR